MKKKLKKVRVGKREVEGIKMGKREKRGDEKENVKNEKRKKN